MRIARPAARAVAGAAVSALAAAGLAGCSLLGPAAEVAFVQAPTAAAVDAHDASAASIAASQAIFERSGLAFLATEGDVAELADDAAELGVPLIVDGPGAAAELERLGAATVAHAAGAAIGGIGGARAVAVDPANVDAGALPRVEVAAAAPGAVLFTDADSGAVDPAAQAAVQANVEAAGGALEPLPGGDPRATSGTVALARAHAGHAALALGEGFGPEFAQRFQVAATQPELPGGGHLALDGKLYIADYGQPGDAALGVLGERDLESEIAHVREQAAAYEDLTDLTVVPTLEIITTVASGALGDGDYSNEAPMDLIRPWVERAGQEGIYVVLDIQPGLDTFLNQAQQYEELLRLPHVGLALDPEWRLKPGQQHLQQIGGTTAAEVNETLAWLAQLTADAGLPQKVVVLHQFTPHMITERETLDTFHDELALLVHVDGHGTPGDKMGTWELMQEDLPEGIALGWKNFIDEDTPMFTPEETVEIEPHPVFVSYQ